MPDLRQLRPDPTAARRENPEMSSPWVRRATTWLKATSDSLTRSMAAESMTDKFAELAAAAREPEEVRVELVRLARANSRGRPGLSCSATTTAGSPAGSPPGPQSSPTR